MYVGENYMTWEILIFVLAKLCGNDQLVFVKLYIVKIDKIFVY